jgi:hypothetical protein
MRWDLDPDRVKRWLSVRLVTDALSGLGIGLTVGHLESFQEDLWSARLVGRLL